MVLKHRKQFLPEDSFVILKNQIFKMTLSDVSLKKNQSSDEVYNENKLEKKDSVSVYEHLFSSREEGFTFEC